MINKKDIAEKRKNKKSLDVKNVILESNELDDKIIESKKITDLKKDSEINLEEDDIVDLEKEDNIDLEEDDDADLKDIVVSKLDEVGLSEMEVDEKFLPGSDFTINVSKREELTKEDKAAYYRFQSKSVFLTYSQVGSVGLKDFVCQLLINLYGNVFFPKYNNYVESVMACREFHQDKGLHFHLLIIFKKRLTTRNSRIFDTLEIHPNIQSPRSLKRVRAYLLKQFLSHLVGKTSPSGEEFYSTYGFNSFFDLVPDVKALIRNLERLDKAKGLKEVYSTLFSHISHGQVSNVSQAMAKLVQADPVYTLRNYKKLETGVTSALVTASYEDYSNFLPYYFFNLSSYTVIIDWVVSMRFSHCLCLIGPTRIGKSTIASQLAGTNPLVITEINGLGMYTLGVHTGLILNDFDFESMMLKNSDRMSSSARSQTLALLDVGQKRTIRVLYQAVHLPANLPIVVTHNTNLERLFRNEPAVLARMAFCHLQIDFRRVSGFFYPGTFQCIMPDRKSHITPKGGLSNSMIMTRSKNKSVICVNFIPLSAFFRASETVLINRGFGCLNPSTKNPLFFKNFFDLYKVDRLDILVFLQKVYSSLRNYDPQSFYPISIYYIIVELCRRKNISVRASFNHTCMFMKKHVVDYFIKCHNKDSADEMDLGKIAYEEYVSNIDPESLFEKEPFAY